MIRTFLGLEIDDDTRAALGRTLAALRPALPRIRWVHPENLHLTLKFLGDVAPADLGAVIAAADEAADSAAPFLLDIEELGCFPDVRRPRVVWAGAGAGAESCTALAAAVEEALAPLGYEPERKPHTPHITLGRIKDPRDAPGLDALLAGTDASAFGTVDVGEIVVFMSELRKGGARYTAMHRAPLRG